MTVTFSAPTVRVLAIGFALVLLGVLLGSTLIKPVSAATQTRVRAVRDSVSIRATVGRNTAMLGRSAC